MVKGRDKRSVSGKVVRVCVCVCVCVAVMSSFKGGYRDLRQFVTFASR